MPRSASKRNAEDAAEKEKDASDVEAKPDAPAVKEAKVEDEKPSVKRGRGRPVSREANSDSAEKEAKVEEKKPSVKRGRGRPPLSAEEKAKREAKKKAPSGRGRGRPKGTIKNKN